jgi:hypothetical protein
MTKVRYSKTHLIEKTETNYTGNGTYPSWCFSHHLACPHCPRFLEKQQLN